MKDAVSYGINVITASLLCFILLARVKPGCLFTNLVGLQNKEKVL